MPVYQIEEEMPASELVEWYAHYKLSRIEAEFEADKAKAKAELKKRGL